MAATKVNFYVSENGDTWLLLKEDDILSVQHRPNAASGGEARIFELGAFLVQERHSPQNRALRDLIASLLDAPGRRP